MDKVDLISHHADYRGQTVELLVESMDLAERITAFMTQANTLHRAYNDSIETEQVSSGDPTRVNAQNLYARAAVETAVELVSRSIDCMHTHTEPLDTIHTLVGEESGNH